MKPDQILDTYIGGLGKYQWMQMILVGLPSWFTAFHFIVSVFHNIIPDHRCQLPDWPNDTYHIQSASHNFSLLSYVPLDKDGKWDSCKLYKVNGSDLETCDQYVFDEDQYGGITVNMEFNLVCDQLKIGTISKTVFTVGMIIGVTLTGFVADGIGRKKTILITMLGASCAGLATMFSVNIIMYTALRFLIGFCLTGAVLVANVLMLEITGPSKRALGAGMRGLSWPLGVMMLSLAAYFVRDWNYLQLTISLPGFLYVLVATIAMNESPRWLISKGKHEEAIKLFAKMAKTNGTVMPENISELIMEDEEEAVKEKLISVFGARTLLIRIIIMFYMWFTVGLGYYGISLGVNNLAGDVYINNLISGAVDLPLTLIIIFSKYFGRKKPFIICLFCGSAAMITSALMGVYLDIDIKGNSAAIITVTMLGKMGIAIVFSFCYLWAGEMFPTTLRTSLVGLCSLMARIGTAVAPVIIDLHYYVTTPVGQAIGLLIFGATAFVGGFLSFMLPETNNKKLPETIQEANDFETVRQSIDSNSEKLGFDGGDDDKFAKSANTIQTEL